MAEVRIAILGTGFIADFRIQAYNKIPGVSVVALMGRTRERAEEFARRHGLAAVTSWDELLRGPAFDAVDICLPNGLHREHALTAARHGKHIICAKPLATTAAEAREMLDAAERAGVVHCYGENWYFAPDFREILDLVRRGTVGRPLWMRGREGHFGPHTPWFFDKRLAGGGSLLDMGCHVIALFNELAGGAGAEDVLCHTATLHHDTDCEDNALAIIRYRGGLVGHVEASWTSRGGMQAVVEIWGDEGMITYDRSQLSQPIKVFANRRTDRYFAEKAESDRGWLFPVVEEFWRYGYYDELHHFAECIKTGTAPRATFREGLAVNEIIDAAYASSAAGRWAPVQRA
jgi:predicted dehydrogenase